MDIISVRTPTDINGETTANRFPNAKAVIDPLGNLRITHGPNVCEPYKGAAFAIYQNGEWCSYRTVYLDCPPVPEPAADDQTAEDEAANDIEDRLADAAEEAAFQALQSKIRWEIAEATGSAAPLFVTDEEANGMAALLAAMRSEKARADAVEGQAGQAGSISVTAQNIEVPSKPESQPDAHFTVDRVYLHQLMHEMKAHGAECALMNFVARIAMQKD